MTAAHRDPRLRAVLSMVDSAAAGLADPQQRLDFLDDLIDAIEFRADKLAEPEDPTDADD